jgi:integration host factor subunit beta
MLKSELVSALSASFPGIARRDVQRALRALLSRITEGQSDVRVELRRFGVFEVRTYPPRPARNPRTGAAILLGERRMLRFKPGSTLASRIAGRMTGDGNDPADHGKRPEC